MSMTMMNSRPMYSQQQGQMRGGSVTLSNTGGSISLMQGGQPARGQYACINPGQVFFNECHEQLIHTVAVDTLLHVECVYRM